MDENYLDDLLKGVSTDNQKKNSFEKNVDKDSGVDIDFADLDDISLDELDSLDDISLDDLDFDELDDVDFDDLDVTNLNSDKGKQSSEYIPEEEEFNADDMLAGVEGLDDIDLEDINLDDLGSDNVEQLADNITDMNLNEQDLDELDQLVQSGDMFDMGQATDDKEAVNDKVSTGSEVNLENTSLSASDIDDLFAQLESGNDSDDIFAEFAAESASSSSSNDSNGLDGLDSMSDLFGGEDSSSSSDIESMDLDDLFSALGIDETEGVKTDNYVSGEDDLDQLLSATMESSFDDSALADIDDIGETKKTKKNKGKSSGAKSAPKEKKTMSEILFGSPDEDDAEEERLFELKKAEKEAKKAKKAEEKELKKVAKQEKLQLKNDENVKKQNAKEEKKRKKDAEYLAEMEAEKGQKKVPTAVVIIVFAGFIALGILVILGSINFNYSQVIKKATDYFQRQRYRLAYEEVAGVEVKEEDEQLRDRIYTVMYVERLYESYENNMTLGRPDKALDSLLRGLEKYDEHYEEAVALGIAKDVKSVKEKIVNSLWNTYGLTEAAAYELNSLQGTEYSDALLQICDGLMPTGE